MANKYFIKNTGLIKASGKDLIDFINRMSTNDFRKLPPNTFRSTVLTTDKGRIVDLINVFNFPDHQLIQTSSDFQNKVILHLGKYIITDDVILEKAKSKYFNIVITGYDLTEIAKNIFGIEAEMNKVYKLNEDEFLFIDDFVIKTLNVICKEESLGKMKEKLEGFMELSSDEYESMRIDAGLPEGENEFNENINPMECGLDKFISFVKGCYIGQEVIARLDSQGKRPKQMVKINSGIELNKNDKIFTGDKEVGFVSSSVNHDGKNLSLGFIRSADLNFDKEYFAVDNEAEKTKIKVLKIN